MIKIDLYRVFIGLVNIGEMIVHGARSALGGFPSATLTK
jgi:hypothetical protein